jgi:plastocyanin
MSMIALESTMLLRLLRFSVPFLFVAMIAVPLLVVHPPSEPPKTHDGSVSMGHEEFGTRHLRVHVGSSIVLRNSSHWLHVIVPGVEAHTQTQPGLPSLGHRDAHISETGDVFRYGPFHDPGRYRLTCSLHPEMNLTVDVVR